MKFKARESEAVKHDLVEVKVQCLKVFCYHCNTSTILLFNSIFRTTPEVSPKLYFAEIGLKGQGLEFHMKYYILHDLITSTRPLTILKIFRN